METRPRHRASSPQSLPQELLVRILKHVHDSGSDSCPGGFQGGYALSLRYVSRAFRGAMDALMESVTYKIITKSEQEDVEQVAKARLHLTSMLRRCPNISELRLLLRLRNPDLCATLEPLFTCRPPLRSLLLASLHPRDLAGCQGSGLTLRLGGLQVLPLLASLDVQNIRVVSHSATEDPVSTLSSLRTLRLVGTGLRSLEAIPRLSNLTISDNMFMVHRQQELQFTSPDAFKGLRQLELAQVSLSTIPRASTLTSLRLSRTLLNPHYLRSCQLPCLKSLSLERIPAEGAQALIASARSLTALEIVNQWDMEQLPVFSHLNTLQVLFISDVRLLREIPGQALGNLPELTSLSIENCSRLQTLSLEGVSTRLQSLSLVGTMSYLDLVPCLGDMRSLTSLSIMRCPRVDVWQSLVHLTALEKLSLGDVKHEQLPTDLSCLRRLRELSISLCRGVHMLPRLDGLRALKKLSLTGLRRLQNLPDLRAVACLKELNVIQCPLVKRLDRQSMPGLEKLRLDERSVYF